MKGVKGMTSVKRRRVGENDGLVRDTVRGRGQ